MKWVAVTFVFFIGGIVLMWWFIGFAEFEYDEITTAFVYAGISPQAGNPNLDYCANNGGVG